MDLFSQTDMGSELNYTILYNSLSDFQRAKLADINSESGARCVLRMWFNSSSSKSREGSFCSGIWDNVYCWSPTHPGKKATRLCSEIFREIHPHYASHLKGEAHRTCQENGSWAHEDETVYSECWKSFESHLKVVEEENAMLSGHHYMLFVGSILSLICLGISIAIFRNFRCLHCDRVTVQTHLMLSLVLRFIIILIITEPMIMGHDVSYRNVDILCESVLVIFLYTTFACTSWMFIQGLYLNITLMFPGTSVITRYHLMIYYFIGWAVPAVFVVGYIIAMLLREQAKCWDGYSEMNERWILLGPIMLELIVNGLFLINILRILLRQVRNSHSRPDASQIKAAAKATAFLFPVLGINNLLLLYNPGGEYSKYFVTLSTFFGSTQGIFVAVVYCFTNKEVLAAIRRSIERMRARRRASFNYAQNNENPQAMVTLELNRRCEDA